MGETCIRVELGEAPPMRQERPRRKPGWEPEHNPQSPWSHDVCVVATRPMDGDEFVGARLQRVGGAEVQDKEQGG